MASTLPFRGSTRDLVVVVCLWSSLLWSVSARYNYDPCSVFTDCTLCTARPDCGWCGKGDEFDWSCVPGSVDGPTNSTCATWHYYLSSCPNVTAADTTWTAGVIAGIIISGCCCTVLVPCACMVIFIYCARRRKTHAPLLLIAEPQPNEPMTYEAYPRQPEKLGGEDGTQPAPNVTAYSSYKPIDIRTSQNFDFARSCPSRPSIPIPSPRGSSPSLFLQNRDGEDSKISTSFN